MGCAPTRLKPEHSKSITSAGLQPSTKEKLLILNMYLHNLANFCKEEIEETVSDGDLSLTVLLKKKMLCVKTKQQEVQQLIAIIDQLFDDEKIHSKPSEVKKIIEGLVKEVDHDAVFAIYVKALRDSEKERERLKKSLGHFEFDDQGIQSESEDEIKKHEMLILKNEPIRHKFKRRKSAFN